MFSQHNGRRRDSVEVDRRRVEKRRLIGVVAGIANICGKPSLFEVHRRRPRTLDAMAPKDVGPIDANFAASSRFRRVFLTQHESNLHPPKGLRRRAAARSLQSIKIA